MLATVLLNLAERKRHDLDAPPLQALGRPRVAFAHENAAGAHRERVDRPALLGVAPDRLDPKRRELVEEPVRQPGGIEERLVDVHHGEMAVEVDRDPLTGTTINSMPSHLSVGEL